MCNTGGSVQLLSDVVPALKRNRFCLLQIDTDEKKFYYIALSVIQYMPNTCTGLKTVSAIAIKRSTF